MVSQKQNFPGVGGGLLGSLRKSFTHPLGETPTSGRYQILQQLLSPITMDRGADPVTRGIASFIQARGAKQIQEDEISRRKAGREVIQSFGKRAKEILKDDMIPNDKKAIHLMAEYSGMSDQLLRVFDDPKQQYIAARDMQEGFLNYLNKAQELTSKNQQQQLKQTAEQNQAIQSLRKEFDSKDLVQSFNLIDAQYDKMSAAYDSFQKNPSASRNLLDQVLINVFNKILDDRSVVRESEYARTPDGQSLLDRSRGFVEKLVKGGVGLTDREREEAVQIASVLRGAGLENVRPTIEQFIEESDISGFDPKRVVGQKFIDILNTPSNAQDYLQVPQEQNVGVPLNQTPTLSGFSNTQGDALDNLIISSMRDAGVQ